MDPRAITITKIEAAHRQLRTAISLWFSGGDSVSIHTLACAAYEIIHTVSRLKGRTIQLMFDNSHIEDSYRGDFAKYMKKPSAFFKHADKDPDASIAFIPAMTDLFIMFSAMGLASIGRTQTDEEIAFTLWYFFHYPHLLHEEGKEIMRKSFPAEQMNYARSVPKHEFLQVVIEARRSAARSVRIPD